MNLHISEKLIVLFLFSTNKGLRSAADSGVMVETVPPPSPHASVSPYYVNDSRFKTEIDSMCGNDFDSEYVDMSGCKYYLYIQVIYHAIMFRNI